MIFSQFARSVNETMLNELKIGITSFS